MKRINLFPIIFCICFYSFSQSGCTDAQAHIVYAFNNAKNSLKANNITHLKFYANKALEAFERVQEALDDCNCADVEAYTIESIEKLYRVPPIAKMAEAQYFVGKAKENAQKIITALDYCTVTDQGSTYVTTTTSSDDKDLSDLEKEQLKLKQQQEALIQKQKALKQQLAKQKEAELNIEKQQLIVKSNAAISKNIQAYNELLDACHCNTEITDGNVKENETQLMSKSVEEIKSYYLKSIKDLTSNYMNMLTTCDNED